MHVFLVQRNIHILQELAAVHCQASSFQNIPNSSYRYKELLGCIWRQRVESTLKNGQLAIPTAALIHKSHNHYLIKAYIDQSKIHPEEWLRKYFYFVVMPLYHLQLIYGIGLVAHGQNTILILNEFIPCGSLLKDFHGDLRLSQDSPLAKNQELQAVEKLPAEYLIHDLITGHFVTLLRYFSRAIEEEFASIGLNEEKFYQILRTEIQAYLDKEYNSSLKKKNLSRALNLLRPNVEKVLVNKVRFIAGYDETYQRLRPLLGKNMKNPLANTSHLEIFYEQ